MSIRNPITGRHEDDLMDEAARNDGQVPVIHLIQHFEEIMGDAGTYGTNVARPAVAAATLLRALGEAGLVDLETLQVAYDWR
jgi:hypothetical protein